MRSGNSSRRPKNAKGNASTSATQLDQIHPSSFNDDETALEAGTELEEKAERFAIGWKAKKYFEMSLAMYDRAMVLNPASQDAPYNCARVLYLLATDFSLPPLRIEALERSTKLYRQSLALALPIEASDGLPSAFYLDVQFNLAVALLALADQMEYSKADSAVRINLLDEAIIQFSNVIDGQELVLHRQKLEEAATEASDETLSTPLVLEEEDAMGVELDRPTKSEYTTSLITPASALETLHNIHQSALALLDLVFVEQDIRRAVQLSISSLQRAQAIFAAFPDGEQRSPDKEWAENTSALRFASLETKIAEVARRTTLKQGDEAALAMVDSFLEEVGQATESLLTLPDEEIKRQQRIISHQLEQLGDQLLTLARTLYFHLHVSIQANASTLRQQTWSLLTHSSKLYLMTLQTLDSSVVGSSAVLGASQTSTATTRRRCSLYTKLSTVSILRSDSLLFQSAEGADKGTRIQVTKNARVYGRKAVTEVGLGWLLSANETLPSQYSLPHGGLESLHGEVEAILILLRALYFCGSMGFLQVEELDTVCTSVRQTLLRGEHGTFWEKALFSSDEARRGIDLMEWTLGEEGDVAVTNAEKEFWDGVYRVLKGSL